jgi:hypothetical protein
MLFKQIIPVYIRKSYKTHKFKIHSYWLLKYVVYIVPYGIQTVNANQYKTLQSNCTHHKDWRKIMLALVIQILTFLCIKA